MQLNKNELEIILAGLEQLPLRVALGLYDKVKAEYIKMTKGGVECPPQT
jgi:hypothetical protein